MDLSQAVQLVAQDQAEMDDILTVADAIDHVFNTLRLPEEPYVAGGYPLEEDGTELAQAYRLVLEQCALTSPIEVAAAAGAEFITAYAQEGRS